MNVALEGNLICHAVKMALHISETAAYLSSFSQSTGDTITKRLSEWKGRSSGSLDFL